MSTPLPPSDPRLDGRKEACKTYIEQIKLLVTLASAFLFAPAAIFGLFDKNSYVERGLVGGFVGAEIAFVLSVLSGYIALGSVSGSQDAGTFDVFRPATRGWSLAQFAFYLVGIALFVWGTARFFNL